ncbi:MAG: AAA family ATPase [Planctomycetota bacterium]
MDRLLLLTRLHLHNYKLHAATEVDLAERPILLLTGANGSGKTQILEALRLALGVHPSPARARGMAACIGPLDSDARITLDTRNPVLDGHRLLKPPHEELARVLDHDTVRVHCRITHSGSVQYRVGSADDGDRGTRLSGRQLRELFRSVNVQAANRLAFTEEGVVDVFAGESGRKKLESLLEATGRLQYLEDLRQALIHLDDATRQAQPLQQKLKWERELVESIRERLEIIRQRSKYLEQHAALCLEHAWAVVRDLEAVRDGLLARTERAEERLARHGASLADAEEALQRTQAEIDQRRRQAVESREAITRERGTLDRLVGRRLGLQRTLDEARGDLVRLEAEREDLGQRVEAEEGEGKREEFQKRQHALIEVEREMRRVLLEAESVAAEIEAATDDVEPDSAEPLATGGTTRAELDMINGCIAFAQALADSGMTGRLIGPVIAHVGIKAGEESWERAVRRLAGRHLFAFIARDREAYGEAKSLFDETFQGRKPPIIIARHSEDERKQKRGQLPRGVHALATDLLEGEAHCMAFLRRVLRGAVAESGSDPNALTDYAEAHRRPVLTRDCQSYFQAFGGFTRPPAPITTPLGTPLVGEEGEASLPADVRRLEARQRDLLLRHAELATQAREMEAGLRDLGIRPQVLERLRTVEERIAALTARVQEATDEDGRLLHQIQVLQKTIDQMVENEQPMATDIDELEASARDLQAEAVRCKTLIAEEEKVVQRFGEEMAGVREQLEAAEAEARAIGERPAEVRTTSVVAQEKNEIKGKLDAIVGQTVDEDNLRRKEEELERLEAYVAERKEHIEKLGADVAERREIWQREVKAMIDDLSRVMRGLLIDGAFRDVRLEVAHVEKPEKAELAIRARTKGPQWLDYRELSGGEKVLCTEALIMALHTMTDSPVHAIDEFTQRLDKTNAASAFDIVRKTFEMTARAQTRFVPQFVLLCPEAFGLEENELINHIVLVEARLREQRARERAS